MKLLDHIALQVDDPREAAIWYCQNFGAKMIYVDDTWSFIQFANVKLAFVVKSQHPHILPLKWMTLKRVIR